MDIPDTLLDARWFWTAWLVWACLFVVGIRRAPWTMLQESTRSHVWLAMIAFLSLVWGLKAGVRPGLDFHLVGATLMTLCVGPWLAFFGLSAVFAVVSFNAGFGWLSFALNALLMAGLPVLVAEGLLRAAQRALPRHLFVFVFVNGFLGSWLAVLTVGTVATALLTIAGVYPLAYLASEYLPYFVLLGFSEAWLAGMLLTLFVVYRPGWVVSFDDRCYLGAS